TGSDFSITASIKLKIAVVPPIPSAKVNTAAAVNTGADRNCLSAYRMLPIASLIINPRTQVS
ncbi:MAG TPA: hypothetical protein VGV15_01255, partial [Terriglobales bacterium]|nr:hypothetical protein [Terriglobales bacterium]